MESLLLIPAVILFCLFIYLAFNFSVLFNLRKRYFFALFIATDAWMCLSYQNWWPKIAVLFFIGAVVFYYVFKILELEVQAKCALARCEQIKAAIKAIEDAAEPAKESSHG